MTLRRVLLPIAVVIGAASIVLAYAQYNAHLDVTNIVTHSHLSHAHAGLFGGYLDGVYRGYFVSFARGRRVARQADQVADD